MLLIGSVYIDHPRSETWYGLQMKYLRRTTKNYTHMVYLNGEQNIYRESEVLAVDGSPVPEGEYAGQHSHVRGLRALIKYFRQHPEYHAFLALDSDCFPFRRWQEKLHRAMGDFGVAAPARYENLDLFAHPCFFYATRQAAESLDFGIFPHTNLVGYSFSDTSANVDRFFPLVRSNRVNHHPILCGVYWNCVYHHAAGSRSLRFRLFDTHYDKDDDVYGLDDRLFKELVRQPDAFLESLCPAKDVLIC